MKLQTPWIVAITIAVVIAMNVMSGNGGSSVTVYSDESLGDFAWHRTDVPPDRWIGIVVDQVGWERLPAEVGVPWTRLGSAGVPSFERDVAVVSFMGTMPTGGHAIALREVEYTSSGNGSEGSAGRLTLRVVVMSPGPGDIVTQAFTYPVAITKLSRDGWPKGVLEGLASGTIEVNVMDQDGRNWGPAHVLAGGP